MGNELQANLQIAVQVVVGSTTGAASEFVRLDRLIDKRLSRFTNDYWGGSETRGLSVRSWRTAATPRRAHSNPGAMSREGAKVTAGTITNPRTSQRFQFNITTTTHRIKETIGPYVNAAGTFLPRWRQPGFRDFGGLTVMRVSV